MIKVLKFGGTSVGTPEAIKQVIEIVSKDKNNGNYPVVVVSAFSGITNQLIAIAESASKQNTEYRSVFKNLEQRHFDAVKILIKPEKVKNILDNIRIILRELESILNEVFTVKDLSKKTLDQIMSFGERLSAYIISETMKSDGIEAEFLDNRPLIKTDGVFGKAEVLHEITDKNIRNYFKNRKAIQIVTGFIASTEQNETTTLGRGGSDYTASIFGAALKAGLIEIWTDVSGMMTADPKKVKDARVIKNMTYEEALKMSNAGAKVIFPPTIHLALKQNIPIVIKNTFRPKDQGTLISSNL